MNTAQPSTNATHTLNQSLVMMQQIALWLIRSGVGYTDFAVALKPIFYEQALLESARIGAKPTDSSLSLLSGLHRRDVNALKHASSGETTLPESLTNTATSVPAQVIGRWLVGGLENSIAITGEAPSFEALVRSISNDKHPKAILQELIRLGVVTTDKTHVHLQQRAFVPDVDAIEAGELFTQSVADHLAAGVHNLSRGQEKQFLEQSVFADGLTIDSIQQLQQLSNQAWFDTMNTVLKEAIELCQQDTNNPAGVHRFRLGMFAYATETQQPEAQLTEPQKNRGDK